MQCSDREADQLAKSLYPFLAEQFAHRVLRDMDWFKFLNDRRPLTTHPPTMAAHAFACVFLEGTHSTNRIRGLKAILAFLKSSTGVFPSPDELSALAKLLEKNPVNRQHVDEWFHRIYPA